MRTWLALMAGQKVKAVEVNTDQPSEAKPYSKPSANKANRKQQEDVQRRQAGA
jgi:hypothetical protein